MKISLRGFGSKQLRIPVRLRGFLSKPLRFVPLRIRSGPNAGRLWSLAVAGRGYWAGRYERTRFVRLAELIHEGDCVWDVGAHQGYSTLVAASRTGSAGRVIAFEPSAYNLWYLERHLKWNGCGNVVVVPAAVSGVDRRARFGGTGSSVSFRLEGGTEIVTVRSGDSLLREGLPRPTFLKVDIEGTEAEMLHGARAVLETVELLTVAIHSRELYESCVALLQDQGFEVHQDVRMRRFLADPPCRWDRDPDLVAVRPHLSERRERVARLGGLELVPGPSQ